MFLLAAATSVAKSAQSTLFLIVFSALQLARFTSALVVNPLWTYGGIVATGITLAVLQTVGLACVIGLWKRLHPRLPSVADTAAAASPATVTSLSLSGTSSSASSTVTAAAISAVEVCTSSV